MYFCEHTKNNDDDDYDDMRMIRTNMSSASAHLVHIILNIY